MDVPFNFIKKAFYSHDQRKQKAMDDLLLSLERTQPQKPKRPTELKVPGIVSISYHSSLLEMLFQCECTKCNFKWEALAQDFKISRLNTLLAFCPDCFQAPSALQRLPTLKKLENRFKMPPQGRL
jgi:hypothetical protein